MNSQRNDQAFFFKHDDFNENDRAYIDPLPVIRDILSDDHQQDVDDFYRLNKERKNTFSDEHEDRTNNSKRKLLFVDIHV